jgi:hypothetical protein
MGPKAVIVLFVMNAHIVIEESPPEWETLSNILKSGVRGGGTVALSVLCTSGAMLIFIHV